LDGRAANLRTVDGDRVVSVLLKTRSEDLASTAAIATLSLTAGAFFTDVLTAVSDRVLKRAAVN